jgi:hypothetical protein
MACDYWAVRTESRYNSGNISLQGCAMSQAGIRRPLTLNIRVRFQAILCETFGGWSSIGTGFSSGTSVVPCQYYSTNVPYPSSWACCSYRKEKCSKAAERSTCDSGFGSREALNRKVLTCSNTVQLDVSSSTRITTYQSLHIQLVQNAPDDGPMRSETCRAKT